MTTLRDAAEALLNAASKTHRVLCRRQVAYPVYEVMEPDLDALRAALAAEDASREQLGRALCKAAGIDPDDVISDAGHVAWPLVAHNALRGVLPTELRDAAWRARAEAAIAFADAALVAERAWERRRKARAIQDADDWARQQLIAYRAVKETCRG